MHVLRRVPVSGWAVGILMTLGLGLAAQTTSPLSGTWRQDVAKSKYSPPELAVKSNASTFQVTQKGVTLVNDGVDAQGRKTHTEYTANFDGKDYPVQATIDGKPSPRRPAGPST